MSVEICKLTKGRYTIMEENCLYPINKCFLLSLLLCCGKNESFTIPGKVQIKHVNGLFELIYNVREQVGIATF